MVLTVSFQFNSTQIRCLWLNGARSHWTWAEPLAAWHNLIWWCENYIGQDHWLHASWILKVLYNVIQPDDLDATFLNRQFSIVFLENWRSFIASASLATLYHTGILESGHFISMFFPLLSHFPHSHTSGFSATQKKWRIHYYQCFLAKLKAKLFSWTYSSLNGLGAPLQERTWISTFPEL